MFGGVLVIVGASLISALVAYFLATFYTKQMAARTSRTKLTFEVLGGFKVGPTTPVYVYWSFNIGNLWWTYFKVQKPIFITIFGWGLLMFYVGTKDNNIIDIERSYPKIVIKIGFWTLKLVFHSSIHYIIYVVFVLEG